MNEKKGNVVIGSFFIVVIMLVSFSVFFDLPRDLAEKYLTGNNFFVGFLYTVLLIVTTVFAPFAGLPFSPITSLIIGPFITTILSVVGWTIGAVIAFLIARYLARPVLSRFVNMERVKKYEEYIPQKHIFLWLVFLRILIPVDILSYAIGLASSIRLLTYTTATFIGIIPFSFIWVYGGHSFVEKNYTPLFFFIGLGLLIFVVSMYVYYRYNHRKDNQIKYK